MLFNFFVMLFNTMYNSQKDLLKIDEIRGNPIAVGILEEIIDDKHVIVSTADENEHYVCILSFVDQNKLQIGCTLLLNNKVISKNSFIF